MFLLWACFLGCIGFASMFASKELRYGAFTLPIWIRRLLFVYINYGGAIELYMQEGRKVPSNKYKFTLHTIMFASGLWIGIIVAHILFFLRIEYAGEYITFFYIVFLLIPQSIIFSVYGVKHYLKKRAKKITVEEQLETLAKLGITPRHDTFIEWLCKKWGRDMAEDMPWFIILSALGGEHKLENGSEALSDNVLNYCIEGIKDNDIYANLLKKLPFYSRGDFNVENVSSTVRDGEEMTISFEYMGVRHHWQLRLDGDCFDLTIVDKVNALMKDSGTSKLFYACLWNQHLFVLYTSDDVVKKLHNLDSWPSYLKFTGNAP